MRPILTLLLFLLLCGSAYGQDLPLWEEYRENFISDDGRVIDHFYDQISHSEGQGYAMLLSVAYGDRETFDSLWKWARDNLAVRKDHLFAWQWGKTPSGRWEVMDPNNATDGDILIAYALLKAGRKWDNDSYLASALNIIKDIQKNLSFEWKGKTLLIPGYSGFEKEDGSVINPSYFIFPAFRAFAETGERGFWEKVYRDSISIVRMARFGKIGLPSDWLRLNDVISAATDKSPYFGYSAIRILLYLSCEKEPPFPEGLGKLLDFYEKTGYIPLLVDIEKGSLSLKPATAGFYAIYALAARRSGRAGLGGELLGKAKETLVKEKSQYFSFTLYLLASSDEVFG